MKIQAIKTRLVRAGEISLEDLLRESLLNFANSTEKNSEKFAKKNQKSENDFEKIREILPENSVLAISSKIVALCENRVANLSKNLDEIAKQESEFYISREFSQIKYMFSITQNTLIPRAGIDESNADGHFVLWPKNAMKSAEEIREFLCKKFSRKNLGVIITDSTCTPLRRGTVGIMIGWSGFRALNDLRGQEDLFGREFEIETSAVANSLAAAANIAMGEGDEQTPLALLTEMNFVKFVSRAPTREEISATFVDKDEDLFAPFFNLAPWEKGGNYKNRFLK